MGLRPQFSSEILANFKSNFEFHAHLFKQKGVMHFDYVLDEVEAAE